MASSPSNLPTLTYLPEAGTGSVSSLPFRRYPLIQKNKLKTKLSVRIEEAAGQTAAECGDIFCCFPYSLVNLLYAVAVKLPAGLLRQALRRRKLSGVGFVNKKALHSRVGSLDDVDDFSIHGGTLFVALQSDDAWTANMASPELIALEKEMSARFYSAGFWRSPSQKEWRLRVKRRGEMEKEETLPSPISRISVSDI